MACHLGECSRRSSLHLGRVLSGPLFIQKYLSTNSVPGPVLDARDIGWTPLTETPLSRTGFLVEEPSDKQGNKVMTPDRWESLLFHSPHLAVLPLILREITSSSCVLSLLARLYCWVFRCPCLCHHLVRVSSCPLLPSLDSRSSCSDLGGHLLLLCYNGNTHTLQCPAFVDMSVSPAGLWTL